MIFLVNFLVIFGVFVVGSESVVVECKYGVYISGYCCDVQNSELITSKTDREISEVRGQHLSGRNNDDVKFFYSDNKKVNFFPRGLTKFFKNIETFQIADGKLQEITKEDLKEFGEKLKILLVYRNKIEVIEGDLFEFNKNLERIEIDLNKIIHIDSGTFDKLEKLHTIDFGPNPCVPSDKNDDIRNNRPKVLELIRDVEKSCQNSEIQRKLISMQNSAVIVAEVAKILKNLQSAQENKIEKSSEKISDLHSKFSQQNSEISTLTSKLNGLEEKISDLDSKLSAQKSEISTLNSKLSIIEQKLSSIDSLKNEIYSKLDKIEMLLSNFKAGSVNPGGNDERTEISCRTDRRRN